MVDGASVVRVEQDQRERILKSAPAPALSASASSSSSSRSRKVAAVDVVAEVDSAAEGAGEAGRAA